MQVIRGNILKTTGLLCNPNFINKRIIGISVKDLLHSGKGSIFPLPTHILTKDGKTGSYYLHQAELTLCFMTMC